MEHKNVHLVYTQYKQNTTRPSQYSLVMERISYRGCISYSYRSLTYTLNQKKRSLDFSCDFLTFRFLFEKNDFSFR
jgi:hypothetical protein